MGTKIAARDERYAVHGLAARAGARGEIGVVKTGPGELLIPIEERVRVLNDLDQAGFFIPDVMGVPSEAVGPDRAHAVAHARAPQRGPRAPPGRRCRGGRAGRVRPASKHARQHSRRHRAGRTAPRRVRARPSLTAPLGALVAREPGQGGLGGGAGAVFEARRRRVAERVQVGQELGDRLLAGARLVAAGHVGDLDVLDEVAIGRAARRARRRPSCPTWYWSSCSRTLGRSTA